MLPLTLIINNHTYLQILLLVLWLYLSLSMISTPPLQSETTADKVERPINNKGENDFLKDSNTI